jgi:hypothetical protein
MPAGKTTLPSLSCIANRDFARMGYRPLFGRTRVFYLKTGCRNGGQIVDNSANEYRTLLGVLLMKQQGCRRNPRDGLLIYGSSVLEIGTNFRAERYS